MSPTDRDLHAAFIAGLDPQRRAAVIADPALAEAVALACARARAAWPHVALADDRFATYLAARLPPEVPASQALAQMHVADLRLACACAVGDSDALRAFEATYFGDVELALGRERSAARADELKSTLRERLYLPREGAAPRLASYSGRASLRTWMRVTITNAIRDLRDAEARRATPADADDDPIAALADTAPDPEMQHWKARYRVEFERAFHDAVVALPPRARRMLHASLVEGASIDVLARRHHVHRATAARWLEEARATLRALTRKHVCARLRLSPVEYDSAARHVRSQVELRLA